MCQSACTADSECAGFLAGNAVCDTNPSSTSYTFCVYKPCMSNSDCAGTFVVMGTTFGLVCRTDALSAGSICQVKCQDSPPAPYGACGPDFGGIGSTCDTGTGLCISSNSGGGGGKSSPPAGMGGAPPPAPP